MITETTETTQTTQSATAPTFDELPLSADIRKAVDAMGYVHPTPVQLAVFEPATRGKNLVVQARTGTGKTAAFGLPILDCLVKKNLAAVQALILTPTRELALQVTRELEQLAQFRGTKLIAIYGGAAMGPQVEALAGGAQIVSGTPGRVLDHIRRGTLDTSNIKILVLDEADEMLSMGFAKELSEIVESLPKERQGLFFSATIPPDIERLANNKLREPEFITLSSDQVGALQIQHFVYLVPGGDKRGALVRVLEVEDPESAIIFCNTKDETERLAELLKSNGYEAEWLNGDLEQKERERIMQRTREGKLRFLVATDVAARGIDISHLTHVINADFPESAEYYVHRTGRTGRAGRTGTAISMIGPKDMGALYLMRLTYKIRPIEKQLPSAMEMKTREEADLVAMFSEAYGARPVHPDDLALARRLLTHADGEVIVAGLLRDHLGARKDDPRVAAAEARRAKNPPPVQVEKPRATREREARPPREREARPPREHEPRRPREHEARTPAEGRGERPRAAPALRSSSGRTDRRGERRAPHASYTEWEPPPEQDDDKPILGKVEQEPPPLPSYREESADSEPVTLKRAPRDPRPEGEGKAHREERSRGAEPEAEEGFTQIFVNIGRRDGARASDLQRLLTDNAGIERKDTGRIRIRDRISFVGVRPEDLQRAIGALAGQVIGGRTVIAEPAKPKA